MAAQRSRSQSMRRQRTSGASSGAGGLGIGQKSFDPRAVWRRFAEHYGLFRGTPTRFWLDHVFATLFGFEERLSAKTADRYYDHISDCLAKPDFRPRALYHRFGIEVIATTETPLDRLAHHEAIRKSGWNGRVITAYRPDCVVDPEFAGFRANLGRLGEITGSDTLSWQGYLDAHRKRRAFFREHGATATDHGHASAATADLAEAAAQSLYAKIVAGDFTEAEAELFRAQMLPEMARMSLDDGMVMQLHPGSFRNHNKRIHERFGRDMSADIPASTDYVRALKPLLDRFGNEEGFTLILFTLDESTYGRELAPLAGHYPCLKLGPAWWFFDSPGGMRRFRELTTETAGFYNTVGFNDDTRAYLSIPARHDMARRIDCGFLAKPDMVSRVTFTKAPAPELPGKIKAQQDAGRVDIDLVLTGTDALSAGITQGLWVTLLPDQESKLPKLQDIYQPAAWNMQSLARGQGVVATYYPSGLLLEYMPDRVAQPPTTAEELLAWAKANPNRFMHARPANSGPGRTFLMGLPYLLGDSDPKDPEKGWDKTWAYLKELGQYVEYYPSGTTATMKELGEGSRDMIASTTGWDINPRVLGIVPKEAKVQALKGFHWASDAHYMVVPKGVSDEKLAVLLDLMNFLLEPQQQAFTYDQGYFYPGPAVKDVKLEMAPAESQQAIEEFGRPEYADLIAINPIELPLTPDKLVIAFRRWDEEIGSGKVKK